MLPIIFAIPSDLGVAILQDWLFCTKSLVALDTASARSSRSAYLALVRSPGLLLAHVALQDHPMNCVQWFNTRHMAVRSLHMTVDCLQAAIQLACLPTVSELSVQSTNSMPETFGVLLRHMPGLLSLSAKDHRDAMPYSWRPPVPADWLDAPLITHLSRTLQDLHLDDNAVIDGDMLLLLATHCHQVRSLIFTTGFIPANTLTVAFGERTFPVLQIMTMNYADSAISAFDNNVVEVLCRAHPMLRKLTLHPAALAVTPQACASALTHCPHFEYFTGGRVEFSVRNFGYQLGLWIDGFYLKAAFESITAARYCRYPVTGFEIRYQISNADVLALISVGSRLTTVCLILNANVTNHTIQSLFKECSLLTTIKLSNCAGLSDDTLMVLADCWQHRTADLHLSLIAGRSFTDAGMCYLLEHTGAQLHVLVLNGCNLLSRATVQAIGAHCHHLQELAMGSTAICAGDLLRYLVEPNALPHLRKLEINEEVASPLRACVVRWKDVHKRWKALLRIPF